jgi:hypothetical protein
MRGIFFLVIFIVLVLPMGFMAVTAGVNLAFPPTMERVSGSWVLRSPGSGVTGDMTIRPDGTCSQTVRVPGRPTLSVETRCSVRHDWLFRSVHFNRFIYPEGGKWVVRENASLSAEYFGRDYRISFGDHYDEYVKVRGWTPDRQGGG